MVHRFQVITQTRVLIRQFTLVLELQHLPVTKPLTLADLSSFEQHLHFFGCFFLVSSASDLGNEALTNISRKCVGLLYTSIYLYATLQTPLPVFIDV